MCTSCAGHPFPRNFKEVVKVILKRLFRVYAHIYHSHMEKVESLGLKAHLNTCFKHFIYFVDEFKFIESKELEPLKEVIDGLMKPDDKRDSSKDSAAAESASASGSD